VAVVYAANNYAITSGQPLDVTTWDNLWTEVTTLRAELNDLKANTYTRSQIDVGIQNLQNQIDWWVVSWTIWKIYNTTPAQMNSNTCGSWYSHYYATTPLDIIHFCVKD
jgi:hypothetical protein